MLQCEGYKMFRGILMITPKNSNPFDAEPDDDDIPF